MTWLELSTEESGTCSYATSTRSDGLPITPQLSCTRASESAKWFERCELTTFHILWSKDNWSQGNHLFDLRTTRTKGSEQNGQVLYESGSIPVLHGRHNHLLRVDWIRHFYVSFVLAHNSELDRLVSLLSDAAEEGSIPRSPRAECSSLISWCEIQSSSKWFEMMRRIIFVCQ